MRFSRWHAHGNVYLLAEDRGLTPERVRAEVGDADGILEVVQVDGAEAEIAIWNPDGSVAELSGNGTRIAARWLARRAEAREVRILVGPRLVTARLRGERDVEQELGAVDVGEPETIDVGGEEVELTTVSVGNPHAVIQRLPDRSELLRLGPLVENHTRFPERTNVQLVRVDGDHELTVGVWERGAGETLSSGTSSVAAAAVAVARGWCASPVTVHLAGGDLVVELDDDWNARLTGPAQEIFNGETAKEFE